MAPTSATATGRTYQPQGVRPPARAGQFYPDQPQALWREVDRLLSLGDPATKPACRAVMLPHAGWMYCGKTIGLTLGRTHVPDRVIVIGPRHTPYGSHVSIAPHTHWEIPGLDPGVAIDTDMVARLLRLAPYLQPEPEAHRMEHGTEVLLPFLHRRNPALRVTPIVLGPLRAQDTPIVGQAVAAAVREVAEPVLLVISSDMNHFAADAENRRLDALALDAMKTGWPQRLYDTCVQHDISMCGMVPAVVIMHALLQSTPAIHPTLVHYTTSAEASGDAGRVVGYAGVTID